MVENVNFRNFKGTYSDTCSILIEMASYPFSSLQVSAGTQVPAQPSPCPIPVYFLTLLEVISDLAAYVSSLLSKPAGIDALGPIGASALGPIGTPLGAISSFEGITSIERHSRTYEEVPTTSAPAPVTFSTMSSFATSS
ncbi:hypothetical protein GH714_020524 [Hevea brasiliensis]|uniref:Uncharacterized protein n=1 Tax=Hevea brasiliensis TaxID=3981 RepID=A0A6A6KKN2_HEVBR|nr:hypothetical protein GH714_020524 [Hevea brasiliensis]